ncbi:RimJ/RimL family protein N-acetyltransferase [Rahnella sp. BIGb0236]|jgi:RimJ/RimL family protein N-acetyltransferase|uniref:GNAT family N-acetyltransferase n=1 Tax=Rahnella sp. BIGb0236 TaxID=2485117 RepID=UPI00105BF1E5|nr:GNAT family N-acetyltransferase [Rahnella sp. BIGb0236]TDS97098.1 RimJ/RimL family protein N-acetyltransferase [Rahnella sp. BIGb0236]VTQ53780.1 Putative ribosomal N-acetyltransferase YdaF [Campylobacter jejuni]
MMTRQIYQDEEFEIRVATELEAITHFAAVQASVKDIGAWESWCSDKYSLEDSRKYLADCEQKRHRGAEFNFCLFERASGNLIGSVGINRITPEYKFANLGYWIRTGYTGRGLATLAARTAARFAFTGLELTRLEIVVMDGNDRSRRVAEKTGAISEGLHRNRLYYHGQPRDAWMYSLIPGDL